MEQESTQEEPLVMVAIDGSNRVFIVRDEAGASWYYTPIAGWRHWDDVPLKDCPPPDAGQRGQFISHDPLWWPDAAAALLLMKAIGKYL